MSPTNTNITHAIKTNQIPSTSKDQRKRIYKRIKNPAAAAAANPQHS